MQNNNYTVYVHTTPSNKKYVGITRQGVQGRWRNGCGYDTQIFGRAITKYGWDNIKHQILAQEVTQQEAEELQKLYIAQWKTYDPDFGYNQTKGGLSGPPPQARKVICLQTKEIFESVMEVCKRYDIKNAGYLYGVCNSRPRRRTVKDKHWAWYDQSKQLDFYNELLKQKIQQQKQIKQKAQQQINEKNRQRLAIKTPVICLDSKKIYKDITEASEDLGIDRENIRRVCVGINYSTNGHYFSFYDENNTLDYYESLLQNAIKKRTKSSCAVRCIQTGIIYPSAIQANKQTGANAHSIRKCCTGARQTAGGYSWQYVSKGEDI